MSSEVWKLRVRILHVRVRILSSFTPHPPTIMSEIITFDIVEKLNTASNLERISQEEIIAKISAMGLYCYRCVY